MFQMGGSGFLFLRDGRVGWGRVVCMCVESWVGLGWVVSWSAEGMGKSGTMFYAGWVFGGTGGEVMLRKD